MCRVTSFPLGGHRKYNLFSKDCNGMHVDCLSLVLHRATLYVRRVGILTRTNTSLPFLATSVAVCCCRCFGTLWRRGIINLAFTVHGFTKFDQSEQGVRSTCGELNDPCSGLFVVGQAMHDPYARCQRRGENFVHNNRHVIIQLPQSTIISLVCIKFRTIMHVTIID